MATATVVSAEERVGAALHSEAVVLVEDLIARDRDVVVSAQIEAVRVLGDTVASRRVQGETGERRVVRVADAERTEGRVLDGKTGESRVANPVQLEEDRLGDLLALRPVPDALAVQRTGTSDGEAGTLQL